MRRITWTCTLAMALCAVAPAGAPGRYRDFAFGDWTLTHNVVYGHAPDADGNDVTLTLDLYQPAGDVAPLRPVLIYAHGGGFTKGNKESGHDGPYAMNFARRGFVSASIDYRLDGSEQHATDDMQAAVRWFRAHAAELRVDPNRIAVIGSSAGAVMALSATFAPEDAGTSGTPGVPSDVNAGLSISGNAEHPETITPGDPPIAMFHAQDDTTIPYAAGQATCRQTQVEGNVCDFYSYPSGGHPPPFAINNREDIAAKSSDFMVRREGIDTVPPATADDVPAGYRSRPIEVTLAVRDDGGSGAYRTFYTTGADPATPTTASPVYDPSAKPRLGDGERIRFFSVDRAGNAEPVRTSARAHVDGHAPVTGDDVPGGWRTEPVAVTLDARDSGGSGLDRTYYTTGVDPPAPTAASPVYDADPRPVLHDGERIRYFSVDRAGNAEAVRTSAPARVDGDAPATADDVPDGWRAQPVPVTLTAADAGGSGVATIHYTTGADPPAPTPGSPAYDPAAKPLLGDGERIRYFAVDEAGNAEGVRSSAPAMVDTEPPSSQANAPASTISPSIAVAYAATDAGAGVDRVELYAKGPQDADYLLADTASAPPGTFGYQADEGPGEYSFYTVARDAVGNAEPEPHSPGAVTTLIPKTRPVALASTALTASRGGSTTVELSNPNPFAVSGRVTIDTARPIALRKNGPARVRRVGTATFAVPKDGRATTTIAVREPLRNVLARRGSLRVTVRRTTTGAGGAATSATTARLTAAVLPSY